jgi:hypothetical protein
MVPTLEVVTVAVPEFVKAPSQFVSAPVPPPGIQTTDSGELQVSVTGVLIGALTGLAVSEVWGWTLTSTVDCWVPQVTVYRNTPQRAGVLEVVPTGVTGRGAAFVPCEPSR